MRETQQVTPEAEGQTSLVGRSHRIEVHVFGAEFDVRRSDSLVGFRIVKVRRGTEVANPW